MPLHRKLGLLAGLLAVIPAGVSSASASSQTAKVQPQPIDDASLKALFSWRGGASPLRTTKTVPHWFGQTLDPKNGVTYGYNMVGADPNHCSGAACDVTVEADTTPIIVNLGGLTFDGTAVVGPTLASPEFATNDYGSTPAATAAGALPNTPALIRGPGGVLSQGDTGLHLQLQERDDAGAVQQDRCQPVPPQAATRACSRR